MMKIEEIAKKINIDENDLELSGKNKAKINYICIFWIFC